jgi:hypothetical protein
MLIDYYIAGRLGQLWLGMHPALKARIGDSPALCLKAARDRQIQPALLLRAQEFAKRVWWRAGMASLLLFLPALLVTALFPGRVGTDIGVGLGLAVLPLAGTAMAQMFILGLRASQTAKYLGQGGTEPLDGYQSGYSSRYDFWAGTGVAVILVAILAYAGLH